MNATFAERLKYAMEQADMSQSALSEKAGASKAAISQYLSGNNWNYYINPTKFREYVGAEAFNSFFGLTA